MRSAQVEGCRRRHHLSALGTLSMFVSDGLLRGRQTSFPGGSRLLQKHRSAGYPLMLQLQ